VRGDDRSIRYAPRGVWFGLILAAGTVRAVLAQDVQDDDRSRRLADPVVLAANQVTQWKAGGAIWVHLAGNSSVLHGVDGLRAIEAVVRIVDISIDGERVRQVEFYAEGDVRLSDANRSSRPWHRGVFRTSEVQLKCYSASGPQAAKNPPWNLAVIRRSGYLERKPAAPPRPAAIDELVSAPTPGTRARLSPLPNSMPSAGAGRFVPTQAVASYAQTDTQVAPSGPSGATALRAGPIPKRDPMIQRAQNADSPNVPEPVPVVARPTGDSQVQPARAQVPGPAQAPEIDLPPIEGAPGVQVPNLSPNREDLPPDIQPLPAPDGSVTVPGLPRMGPVEGEPNEEAPNAFVPPVVPIMGGFRTTSIFPRSGRRMQMVQLPTTPEGVKTYIFRGGITLVSRTAKSGTIDIEADEAVIWRAPDNKKGEPAVGPNGETWVDDSRQPMEVYLEGNVILRQDENKFAGKGDQRTVRAPRMYYDFLTDRFLAPNAEIDMFAPSLLAPIKIKSPLIQQFRRPVQLPNGTFVLSEQPEIRAEPAVMTGSRFPDAGYTLRNSSIDLTRHTKPLTNPNTGQQVKDPDDPDAPPQEELVWKLDARQNFYFAGPIPVFYWPHVVMDLDDLEPPLRMIGFATNNYFGQQLRVDFNGFRLINRRRPKFIDIWNVDVDYLSARTKDFPALGSEMGWFGADLIQDLRDPYREDRNPQEHITKSYFGYFDIWGLKDAGIDVLGTGPAIVTNGPPGAGKAGFQRQADPPFQSDRGRFNIRHNQRFLPEDDEHRFEELRLQVEVAYASDRNFIEEYYKRLFDTGLDQETLAYGIWQKDNQYANIWAEGNFQNWYTDTQWLPRVDYYRLGDSFFNNLFTYYTHSGMDYATIHTDVMVNNPNLFAFLPFDPISNTTGTFSSGRFYTNHELDMPLNFGNVVRFVPYVQGQAVGWSDQLGGGPLGHQPTGAMGRIWGAAGARAEVTAWKKYPNVESELLNIHGLNNKLSLFADARTAYSNQQLNKIAVQDDLNDNTYEYVLRYEALTQFTGGLLPFPYDPRHLLLRQTLSPITDTTDIQASINTVQLGLHQRLQTKRGPIGKRRIVDYMTLDASTTYFPTANRDNFGTPWGQAMYNYQWYLGDRTSIVSSGWFDFFKLVGSTPLASVTGYNPNGLNIITSGISISRPPRSNIFLGYSIIDTGPIKTSAINVSMSYWLSPKWYGTFSESYDFGDAVSLGTMFAFTRIGADYLTTIGLTVDPQRQSYMFAFSITPRLSPGLGSGSTSGTSFDTRFAPTQ
jgi:hypothetical protein